LGKHVNIKVDTSTRDSVINLIGQPHLKLQNDQLWIYGQSRITWERVPPPHQHEFFALLIKFTNETVSHYEFINNRYPGFLCWSNDMCLESHWEPIDSEHGPKKLNRKFSAVVSRGSDDKEAKLFRPDHVNCSIYIYKEFDFFQLPYPPTVTVGALNDEPVSGDGYLYVAVVPGGHVLQAAVESVEFSCNPGDLIFYAVSNRGFVTEPETEIKRISAKQGKKAVLNKRRLVTW